MPQTAIKPKKHETEEQFTIRAHRELMQEIPDWRERNAAVWDAWDQDRGPGRAKKIAAANFPPDRFSVSPGHCYFVEHDRPEVDRTGKATVKKFGVHDLCDILRSNNSRVLERESFAAIVDGHTLPPTESNPAPQEPEVLGYAGPYRLGMVGYDEPKFAIFGDEYQDKSKLDRLRGKPRRSVELLRMRSTGEQFFDPIAVLGALAPRLPMPARYAMADVESEDVEVERYSFSAPQAASFLPGGSNTHLREPEKFSAEEEQPSPPQTEGAMLTNEDIAQILDAVSQLPPFKYFEQMMNGGAAGGQPGQAMPGAPMGADPAAGGMGGELPPGGPEGMEGLDDGSDPGAMGGDDFSPLEDDEEPNRMSAQPHYDTQRYAALEASHNNLIRHVGILTEKLQKADQSRSDITRENAIRGYCDRYAGIFDYDTEIQRCLYSHGSSMTDQEFDQYRQDRESVGARAVPNQIRVPYGALASEDTDVEKYSARAYEIHAEHVNKTGESLAWDDCVRMAKEGK